MLVLFIDRGERPEIARQAREQPLALDSEKDKGYVKGTEVKVGKGEVDEGEHVKDTGKQASPDMDKSEPLLILPTSLLL